MNIKNSANEIIDREFVCVFFVIGLPFSVAKKFVPSNGKPFVGRI